MTSLNSYDPIEPSVHDLHAIASKADTQQAEVVSCLNSLKGRFVVYLRGRNGEMPVWAANYLEMHKQLMKAVDHLKSQDKDHPIPENVARTLERSKAIVKLIAAKVNYAAFCAAISPYPNTTTYADTTKLLVPLHPNPSPMHSNIFEWELNFSLLHSAYQRATDPDTRTTIRFLMINYLAKAAYLNASSGINLSDADTEMYKNLLQLGQLTMGGMYNRNLDTMVPVTEILELDHRVGSRQEKGKDLIALDTMNITPLYDTSFVRIPDLSNEEQIVDILVEQVEKHIDEFRSENMEFPLLIDITKQIGRRLITEGDPARIKKYERKQQEVKEKIDQLIGKAVKKLIEKHPKNRAIKHHAGNYLLANLVVVSRASFADGLAVLGLHRYMFDDRDFKYGKNTDQDIAHHRHERIRNKVKSWAGYTGVSLGAVNLRHAAATVKQDPISLTHIEGSGQPVSYGVTGRSDIPMYNKPDTITGTNVFRMLTALSKQTDEAFAGQQLLAKATVRMMETLFGSIPQAIWDSKQHDPIIRELTGNALVRITEHLAAAVDNVEDFRKFSQAIDLIHAELTTILALYKPFQADKFETAFETYLAPNFPDSIGPISIGVARSAMTVFAGVNAAIIQNHPNPVRICAEHSYYEAVALVGGNRTLENTLDDEEIDHVDLYVGEFNHNIEVDPNYTHYEKGTVFEDIREIFAKKPNTDALNVMIDATLDFTRSNDIKRLFEEFETEINEGKLNIIVFRSGQKFDMMGLDNYYGGVFYMVNNGDAKWEHFNILKTEKIFQADELSQQFFCWMGATGLALSDRYKKQIFENTKEILKKVPVGLQPVANSEVCVCQFERNVKTPFIDIKINLSDPDKKEELRSWAQKRFIELFLAEEKLVYVRGSFGFPHPNITWIDPKMRINPGVDPTENRLYEQFFNEFEAKFKELETESFYDAVSEEGGIENL